MDDTALINEIQALYERASVQNNVVECASSDTTVSAYASHGKRYWTSEQDAALFTALKHYGCRWRAIAKYLNMGSDDAVRNRVLRFKPGELPDDVREIVSRFHDARPTTKRANASVHRPYTPQEDEAILEQLSYAENRQPWKTLQQGALWSRTTHSIRNRAYRLASTMGCDLRPQAKTRKRAIVSKSTKKAHAA